MVRFGRKAIETLNKRAQTINWGHAISAILWNLSVSDHPMTTEEMATRANMQPLEVEYCYRILYRAGIIGRKEQ